MSGGRIATVGMFDGLHRGHAFLLQRLKAMGESEGLVPTAVTFSRHPLAVVAPERAPHLLTTPEEKVELVRALGVEPIVLDFTPELRMMTAREFMRMLRDSYDVKSLVLGFNNRIGHERDLTLGHYRAIGSDLGVKVEQVEAFEVNQRLFSSSAIRALLREGSLAEANSGMGHRYTLQGVVGHGKALGRTIGFPTANIEGVDPRKLMPQPGVYAAIAVTEGGGRVPAMLHIGRRPTIDSDPRPTIEAHLIGFDGDLYGQRLKLELVERIRDQRKFESVDALAHQLALDREQALALLVSR